MVGLAAAIATGVRHGAATVGVALLFAAVAVRQGLLLHGGVEPDSQLARLAAELAILSATLGGWIALRSLRRTTRERDRVEDLHWDSMEAVRAISELTARPGADLSDRLRILLDLGAARFDLDVGIAWRESGEADGELLAVRAPDADAARGRVAELLPRLREAARGTRPAVLGGGEAGGVLFAGPFTAGDARGAIAFAGTRDGDRLTATDKDLLGLMAVWLAGELERSDRSAPPEPARPVPPRRRQGIRRDRDLNAAVRRAERSLRRVVGADATLEIALAPELPPVDGGRLPLPTLVESLVVAAARLAPSGRIRVETSRLADAGPAAAARTGDVTLSTSVTGDVEAAALERIFEEPRAAEPAARGSLPLATLERLLRRHGADLSVAVEPGRRALLTAYLPAAAPAPSPAARRPAGDGAARPDQPSR